MRRALLALLAALAFAAAGVKAQPLAGIDYRPVPGASAHPTAASAHPKAQRVEVLYFFWYRCPHCYALQPLLPSWLGSLPRDVKFKPVPAVLGKEWLLDARIFYALDALGELERLHRPLLDAIHTEGGRRLNGTAYAHWVAAWLEKHGVDRAAYAAAFDSRAVDDQLRKAAALARSYRLEATPTMVVAGRYIVDPPPDDRRRILDTTAYLVQQIRSQHFARR